MGVYGATETRSELAMAIALLRDQYSRGDVPAEPVESFKEVMPREGASFKNLPMVFPDVVEAKQLKQMAGEPCWQNTRLLR